MKDNKLCTAGILLEQRMELGVKNLQIGAAEVRSACKEVSETLQNIRITTAELNARLDGVEQRTAANDKQTAEINTKVESHIGVHIGVEKAGIVAGRKSGMIYGFAGAILGSITAAFSAWRIFLGLGS